MISFKKSKIALLLALSLVITGIPFPGNVNAVQATVAEDMTMTSSSSETVIINQTFDDFEEGTKALNVTGANYSPEWGISYHDDKAVVTPKTMGTGQWLEFTPVTSADSNQYALSWYMRINEEYQYPLGSGVDISEGNFLVVEMDLALTGEDAFSDAVMIRMGGDGDYCLAQFNLFADHIGRSWGYGSGERGGKTQDGKNAYTQGEVGHLKWILNRTTKKFSWIWNGVVFETDYTNFNQTNTPALKYILVSVPVQTLADGVDSIDTKFAIDNVQMYVSKEDPLATPAPTAEPTPEPTPAPTAEPTAAPTYSPVFVDETFESYELLTQSGNVKGNYWTGKWGSSYNENKVVVAENSDGTGKWLEFTPVTSADSNRYALPWYINFSAEKQYAVGTGTDVTEGNYLVVEMDLALTGEDAFSDAVMIRMGGDGDYCLAQFNLYADHIGRSWGSGSGERGGLVAGKNDYTQGEVGHLKWILNRTTKKFSWIWNGVVFETDYTNFNQTNTPALKYILVSVPVQTLAEGVDSIDTKFAIDNIQVYVSKDDPMATPAPTAEPTATPAPTAEPTATPVPTATPAPTAAPTYSPVFVDETFESYELLTQSGNVKGNYWTGKWGSSYNENKVVVAENSDRTGKWLEFTPVTSADSNQYALPWYINFSAEKQYAVGTGTDVTEGNYLVVEMDLALTGEDAFSDAVMIRMGGDGDYCLAQFNLFADHIGRSWGYGSGERGGLVAGKNDYTQGEVGHLKWVLDRTTKKFSWTWNGVLNDSDYTNFNQTNTPAFRYIMVSVPVQTLADGVESIDTKFAIDNVKVYVAETSPFATPAPTAEPTATPAPTATPEPTAVPEHTHEPDEKGYCKVEGCGEIANGKAAVYKRNLVLNDTIGVNFYVELTDAVNEEDIVMKFKLSNGKTAEVKCADATTKTIDGKVCKGFAYEVFASEMNQTIMASMYEGEELLGTYTYSVKNYCDNQKQNEEVTSDAKTVAIIDAMLTYGAMSQNFFKTGDELVTDSIPVALTTLEKEALSSNYTKKPFVQNAADEISVHGMTLVLFSKTSLRAGFILGDGVSLEDYTFKAYDMTNGGVEVSGKTGVYGEYDYFEITGINPAELSNNYKIVVTKADQTVIEIEYSPFTYINSKMSDEDTKLVDVVTSMYRYNEAAKAYVAK